MMPMRSRKYWRIYRGKKGRRRLAFDEAFFSRPVAQQEPRNEPVAQDPVLENNWLVALIQRHSSR